MASRIGEWFAFSSGQFCRVLTVHSGMAWGADGEAGDAHVLKHAAMVAAAPLGGPIAVTHPDRGAASLSPRFGRVVDYADAPQGSTSMGGRDPREAAAAWVDVFDNNGAMMGRCRVPLGPTDAVARLSWTKEEDLCVLTRNQFIFLYSVAHGDGPVEATAVEERPPSASFPAAAACPARVLPPMRAFSLLLEASVPVMCFAASATPGEERPAVTLPVARPRRTTVALATATSEGVVTVDHQRTLRALLHGDRQTATPLRAARLPLTRFEASQEALHRGHKTKRSVAITTAMAFVAPDSHDGGTMLLLWATSLTHRSAGGGGVAQSFVHVATWDDLVAVKDDADALRGEDEFTVPEATTGESGDAAVDTGSHGGAAKHGQKRPTERPRPALLKKEERLLTQGEGARDAMRTTDGARRRRQTGVISSDNVSTAVFRGSVVALERCPYDASRVAVLTDTGRLSILSSDLSCLYFSLETRLSLHIRNGNDNDSDGHAISAVSGTAAGPFFLHDLAWCGRCYALLHLSRVQRESTSVAEEVERTEPFALLVPLSKESAVRAERLDWLYDGSDALVLVPEVDGARVITDGGCYFVQHIPPALAVLCELQPPFHPAREYLAAYTSYAGGKSDGLVRVRAVLAKHRKRCEEVFLCLLEAACCEMDRDQQLRFLSAASFLQSAASPPVGGASHVADTVTRLRILRALRLGGAAGDAAEEGHASGALPLTMGQYAFLTGLFQMRDGCGDDAYGGGESEVLHSFLIASQPITANEGLVLVDRLLARQAYQIALRVCSAYGGAKGHHVLEEWACSKVRNLADNADDKARLREEAHVVRCIDEACCGSASGAGYMGCATVAFSKGRTALALRLLRGEPPSGPKVRMLLGIGHPREAMQAAVESRNTDLLYLALHRILVSGVCPAAADMLLSFPDAMCCLLNAAALRPTWRRAAVTILLDHPPPACRWWFASRLGFYTLNNALQGYGEGELQELCAASSGEGHGPDAALGSGEDTAQPRKRNKRRTRKGDDGGGGGGGDVVSGGDDGGGCAASTAPLLPHLFVPKPPLSATPLCIREEDKQSLFHVFKQADALSKQPQALPSAKGAATARVALMKAVWGLDRLEEAEQGRWAERMELLQAAFGEDSVPASLTFYHAHDPSSFSSLSPSSMLPHEVLDALQRQRSLEQHQQRFAQAYKDPRFAASAVSVVDTIALLTEHGAQAEAERLRGAFGVGEKKFFLAVFRSLCDRGRWDDVARALGPPPLLLLPPKRTFLALSEWVGEGESGAAEAPPGGYEGVVETLLSFRQKELAARYVPGISTDPATRVDWYMNRMDAPVMALEAAYVGESVELLRQILRRVPQNPRVQQMGASMIAKLEGKR